MVDISTELLSRSAVMRKAPDERADDRAPQGRELSVREVLTRIIVDWWNGKRGVGHRPQASTAERFNSGEDPIQELQENYAAKELIASETRSYGMDQDTAGHSFTLRKDVVLNGMIIAIETRITIALSEIWITSSFCAPT